LKLAREQFFKHFLLFGGRIKFNIVFEHIFRTCYLFILRHNHIKSGRISFLSIALLFLYFFLNIIKLFLKLLSVKSLFQKLVVVDDILQINHFGGHWLANYTSLFIYKIRSQPTDGSVLLLSRYNIIDTIFIDFLSLRTTERAYSLFYVL
jgi:hypothetical protein